MVICLLSSLTTLQNLQDRGNSGFSENATYSLGLRKSYCQAEGARQLENIQKMYFWSYYTLFSLYLAFIIPVV